MTVCIVDTSILVELLNVPGFASKHDETLRSYVEKSERKEQFLLPIPVLLEAGNHVAQVADGNSRRAAAKRFITLATSALDGDSPFAPTHAPSTEEIRGWLPGFEEDAVRKVGLVDRTLIHLWEIQRKLLVMRRVYIWSLDHHLVGYDTGEIARPA